MCNLHWCYTFCTSVTLFALVLHWNCTALSLSELSNFFMCIISKLLSYPYCIHSSNCNVLVYVSVCQSVSLSVCQSVSQSVCQLKKRLLQLVLLKYKAWFNMHLLSGPKGLSGIKTHCFLWSQWFFEVFFFFFFFFFIAHNSTVK